MLRYRNEATDVIATLLRVSIWGAGRMGELTHLAVRGARQVQGALATASATIAATAGHAGELDDLALHGARQVRGALATASATITATATAVNRVRAWVFGRGREPAPPIDHGWVVVDSPQSSTTSSESESDDDFGDDNGGLFDDAEEGLAEGYALVGGDNEDDSDEEGEDRDDATDSLPAYHSTPETHQGARDGVQHHEPRSTSPMAPSVFSPHQPEVPEARWQGGNPAVHAPDLGLTGNPDPRPTQSTAVWHPLPDNHGPSTDREQITDMRHMQPQDSPPTTATRQNQVSATSRAVASVSSGGILRTGSAASLTRSGMSAVESLSHDAESQESVGGRPLPASEETGGGFESVAVYGDSGPVTRRAQLERARRYGRGPLGGGY
ncbi:hypothetical protein B0J18DRAFT_441080 [Chaetomium sp. MPI-SDFR-AT-0129]|nr:hypothetical protein B0J18DRAFT_441080 [Chaetomium sp. MPI-SDFR-AT-0129]